MVKTTLVEFLGDRKAVNGKAPKAKKRGPKVSSNRYFHSTFQADK